MGDQAKLQLVMEAVGDGQVVGALNKTTAAVGRMGGDSEAAAGRSAAAMGRMAAETETASGRMAAACRTAQAALAAIGFGVMIKEAIDAALVMERITAQFNAVTGSAALAAREISFIRGEVNRLGLEYQTTASAYAKFMASTKNTAIEGEATRRVFTGVSEAVTAMKLTGGEANGIFKALSQMMSKGKVSAEELTQQLGEHLPGSARLAADAMGLTTAELFKQMEQGKIMSADLLPKLADQLHKTYGAAAMEAAQGGQAEINRFKNAVFESKAALGTALMPILTDMLKLFKGIAPYITAFIGGLQMAAVDIFAFVDKFKALVDKGGLIGLITGGFDGKDPVGNLKKEFARINQAADEQKQAIFNKYETPATGNKSATDLAAEAATNAARVQKEKAAAQEAARKKANDEAAKAAAAAKAYAEQQENAYVKMYNSIQDKRKENNPLIDEEQRALVKLRIEYDNFIATLDRALPTYQAHRDELERNYKLDEAQLQLTQKLKKEEGERAAALKLVKAAKEQDAALEAIRNKNIVDAAELKAAKSSTKGFGFGAIDDQLAAEKAAIKAKYDMEQQAIQDKIDLLQTGTDMEMAQVDAVHQARMAAIDAENKARFFDQPQKLAEAASAQASAEKGYSDKISSIKTEAAVHTAKMIAALNKSLQLSISKEQQENLSAEQRATSEKLTLAANYTGMAGQLFQTLADTQDESSRAGFESAKDYNLAAVVMNTASAVMAQLSVPGPAGWAAAALAGVTGAANYAKIESTEFGGGGGGAVSAPSGSAGGSGGGGSMGRMGAVPLTSMQDSQLQNSETMLAAAMDRNSVVIGRLSKSMEDLFKAGGVGNGLATNAPGRFTELSEGPGAFKNLTEGMKTSLNGAWKYTMQLIKGDFGEVFTKTSQILGLSSFFGIGNKWNTTGAGLSIGTAGGQFGVQDFTTQTKKGGWFSSDKTNTTYADNAAAGDYLNQLMLPYVNDLGTMADTLGLMFDPAKYEAAAIKISTAGKTSDQIGEELTALMASTLSGMTLTIDGLGDMIGSYDDAYTRITQINDAWVTANEQLQLVGIAPLQQGLGNAVNAENAQNSLFGGRGGFIDAMSVYRDAMFTQPEKDAQDAAAAQRQVNTAWQQITGSVAGAGLELPTTNEAFNALRASIDPNSPLFAALTGMGESFATVTAYADELRLKEEELAKARKIASEDMSVRELNAVGNKDAAALLGFDISAGREIEQAIADNLGDAYLERLRAVLSLERGLITDTAAAAAATASYGTEYQAFTRLQSSARAELSNAEAAVRAAFSAEKNSITASYNSAVAAANARLKDLNSTVSDLSGFVNMLASAKDRMQLQDDRTAAMSYRAAQATMQMVLYQARKGDLSGLKTSDKALDTLVSQGTDAYANSIDYQRDFYRTTALIDELSGIAGHQLTDAQRQVQLAETELEVMRSNHEAQLLALDAQLNATLGVNDSVLSLAAALGNYQAAKAAVDMTDKQSAMLSELGRVQIALDTYKAAGRDDLYQRGVEWQQEKITEAGALGLNAALINGDNRARYDGATNFAGHANAWDPTKEGWTGYKVPGFASGGDFGGGLRLVGEDGPELELTGPSRILNHKDTSNLFDNDAVVSELKALRAEQQVLRAELKAANVQLANNTQKTARIMTQWEGEGMPDVRAA